MRPDVQIPSQSDRSSTSSMEKPCAHQLAPCAVISSAAGPNPETADARMGNQCAAQRAQRAAGAQGVGI